MQLGITDINFCHELADHHLKLQIY